eukprot:gene18040-21535_t
MRLDSGDTAAMEMNTLTLGSSFTYNFKEWNYSSTVTNHIRVWIYKIGTEPPFIHQSFNVFSERDAKSFADYIETLPSGTLVAIRVLNGIPYLSDTVYNALYSIGCSAILDIKTKSTPLATIGTKGSPVGTAIQAFMDVSFQFQRHSYAIPDILSVSITDYFTSSIVIGDQPLSFDYGIGLNVLTFNNNTLQLLSTRKFDTTKDTIATNILFVEYINGLIQEIDVLILVVARCPPGRTGASLKLSGFNSSDPQPSTRSVLESTLGSNYIESFQDNAKWFLLSLNGSPLCESTASKDKTCSCVYYPKQSNGHDVPFISAGSFNGEDFSNKENSYILVDKVFSWTPPKDTLPKIRAGLSMTTIDDVLGTPIYSYFIDCSGVYDDDSHDSMAHNGFITVYSMYSAAKILSQISLGTLVVVCTGDLPNSIGSSPFRLSHILVQAFRSIGANLSHKINSKSSYCLIGRKGCSPGSVPESLCDTGPVSLFSYFGPRTLYVKPYIEIRVESKGFTDALDLGYTRFFINSQPVSPFYCSRGLNVMVINQDTATIQLLETFDTYISNESEKLVKMLQSLPVGRVVAIGAMDEYTLHLGTASKVIQSLLGGIEYAICVFQMPVKSVLDRDLPPHFLKSYNASKGGITLDGSPAGVLVENCNYAIQPPYNTSRTSLSETNTLQEPDGGTLFGRISRLQPDTIVIITITSFQVLSDSMRLALSMIGASQYDIAMQQPDPCYLIVGKKGISPGGACELYSSISGSEVQFRSSKIAISTSVAFLKSQVSTNLFDRSQGPGISWVIYAPMWTPNAYGDNALRPFVGFDFGVSPSNVSTSNTSPKNESLADYVLDHAYAILKYLTNMKNQLMKANPEKVVLVTVTRLIEDRSNRLQITPDLLIQRIIKLYEGLKKGDSAYLFITSHGCFSEDTNSMSVVCYGTRNGSRSERDILSASAIRNLCPATQGINYTTFLGTCVGGNFFYESPRNGELPNRHIDSVNTFGISATQLF